MSREQRADQLTQMEMHAKLCQMYREVAVRELNRIYSESYHNPGSEDWTGIIQYHDANVARLRQEEWDARQAYHAYEAYCRAQDDQEKRRLDAEKKRQEKRREQREERRWYHECDEDKMH